MENAKQNSDTPPLVELRVWMAKTGRRQRHVARLIDVSDAEFSIYFRGMADLDLDAVAALSKVSGIPPHRLVNSKEVSLALKSMLTRAKRETSGKRIRTQKQAHNDNAA